MARQDSSFSAKIQSRVPSENSKHNADSKRGTAGGASSGNGKRVRLSPYVRRTAKRGSKQIAENAGCLSSRTQKEPSGAIFTLPKTVARTCDTLPEFATTFVNSVISLCNKSIVSCRDISEPVPDESMFLFLVPLCGIREAKFWAQKMRFNYKKSYALLSTLLYGLRDQFSQAPETGTDTSHCGGHAQG
jgi:hypothetical protein